MTKEPRHSKGWEPVHIYWDRQWKDRLSLISKGKHIAQGPRS